jgi:hypothetical protein
MAEQDSEAKLPETPFNGVVVSVGLSIELPSIAIMSTDEPPGKLLVVFHWYNWKDYDGKDHLRPGHKVKVTSVDWWKDKIIVARSVEFEAAELGRSYLASQSASQESEEAAKRQPE